MQDKKLEKGQVTITLPYQKGGMLMFLHTEFGKGEFNGKKLRVIDSGASFVLQYYIKENEWESYIIKKDDFIIHFIPLLNNFLPQIVINYLYLKFL